MELIITMLFLIVFYRLTVEMERDIHNDNNEYYCVNRMGSRNISIRSIIRERKLRKLRVNKK